MMAFSEKKAREKHSSRTSSGKDRSMKYGLLAAVSSALLLAVLVVFNLILAALPSGYTRIDTTAEKLYSLSDQSKQILSGLTEDITLHWVVASNQEDERVGRLLESYRSESDRIRLEKVDPLLFPEFIRSYTDEDFENNCVVATMGSRSRYIPNSDIFVMDVLTYYMTGDYEQSFEGEAAITGAIDYLATAVHPILGLLTGHGETELDAAMTRSLSRENYRTETLSLLSGSIPESFDCVLINSPQRDISEAEVSALTRFLEGGGDLLLVTDLNAAELPNLMSVTEAFGVTPVPGLLLEGDPGRTIPNYNYFLLPGFASHPIVEPFRDGSYFVIQPAAHALSIAGTLPENVTAVPLLRTTASSYNKKEGRLISTYEREASDESGPFVTGTAMEKQYSGNKASRIVWYTSPAMFTVQYDQLVSGCNTDLFLNTMAWLCEKPSSVSIRAKKLSGTRLTVLASEANLYSVLLIGVIPLLVLLSGIIITVLRRRK